MIRNMNVGFIFSKDLESLKMEGGGNLYSKKASFEIL